MSTQVQLEPLSIAITERDAQAWSEILDDQNPLHTDPEAALAHGMDRGVVSPGPASAAHLLSLLLRSFPGAFIEHFAARFMAPVVAPATMEARGVCESEERTARGRIVHCSLELWTAGSLAVAAKARVLLADHSRSREA